MAANRNAGKHIGTGREPPASGAGAPTGRRRRIFLAAVLGTAALAAMSVLAAVGAFNGNAATLTFSDNFDRANGALGSNWTGVSDGALAISAQAAAGTHASGISGDIWTAESYSSNQYSQVGVTSAQLTGGQWIGPAVRLQEGGQNGYAGIYNWNNGSPELMLFKRTGGKWAQLGKSYSSGPLAAGTVLKLEAVGSTLAFLENGTERIAVYDPALTGGAPAFSSPVRRRPATGRAAPPGSQPITSARTRMASHPTT